LLDEIGMRRCDPNSAQWHGERGARRATHGYGPPNTDALDDGHEAGVILTAVLIR
jgi:hypothetical protein